MWEHTAHYAASKAGLATVTRLLALEWAPDVRVNGVAPGAIRTPINTAAWQTPDAYSDLMILVPYKRIGEPEDIAQAVVWLVSAANPYANGQKININGGG